MLFVAKCAKCWVNIGFMTSLTGEVLAVDFCVVIIGSVKSRISCVAGIVTGIFAVVVRTGSRLTIGVSVGSGVVS